MHYTGGFDITKIERIGRNAVAVSFEHSYSIDVRFQLYQNRTKIGCTTSPEETRIVGAIPAGVSAAPLGIIVVTPEEAATDFADRLDLRPWNEYQLSMSPPVDPPADLHHFDLVASRYAGQSIDDTNIVSRNPFNAERPAYSEILPTFPNSGTWSVALIPRDNSQPSGNAGDPITGSVVALIYPLDFIPISSAAGVRRFSYEITDGVLSITSTYGVVPTYP